jgi:hypothetical protein
VNKKLSDEELARRGAAVARIIDRLTVLMEGALKERRQLIAAMRLNDWGYDRIATALGITKARASQLVKSPGGNQMSISDRLAIDGRAELELRQAMEEYADATKASLQPDAMYKRLRG